MMYSKSPTYKCSSLTFHRWERVCQPRMTVLVLYLLYLLRYRTVILDFPGGSVGKNPPAMQKTQERLVQSLGHKESDATEVT